MSFSWEIVSKLHAALSRLRIGRTARAFIGGSLLFAVLIGLFGRGESGIFLGYVLGALSIAYGALVWASEPTTEQDVPRVVVVVAFAAAFGLIGAAFAFVSWNTPADRAAFIVYAFAWAFTTFTALVRAPHMAAASSS